LINFIGPHDGSSERQWSVWSDSTNSWGVGTRYKTIIMTSPVQSDKIIFNYRFCDQDKQYFKDCNDSNVIFWIECEIQSVNPHRWFDRLL
jgi:hypothetical protein